MGEIIGFDLETDQLIPTSNSILQNVGITCAALWHSQSQKATICHGAEQDSEGLLAPSLTAEEAGVLVDYMMEQYHMGATFVTWNGAAFDFQVLADQSQRWDDCRALAKQHVDIAFLMLCTRGFMAGIAAMAQGLKIPGKTEGMHGSLAPIMWRRSREEQNKVLQYVTQDARLVAEIYRIVLEQGYGQWVAQSGKLNTWEAPILEGRLLTVAEGKELPLPDTSWMTNPRSRQSCVEWIYPEEATQINGAGVGVAEISQDSTRLEGDLLQLDLAHNTEARAIARAFAALIRQNDPTLAQAVERRLAQL